MDLDDLLPPGARPTPRPETSFSPYRAVERLRQQFETSTVASLGLDERPLAARATAALLGYVEETLPSALHLLERLEVYAVEGSMVLDAATRRSLELTETLRGVREGSLLGAIDETKTAMGARMLRRWLTQPLLDAEAIIARHEAVDWLASAGAVRAGVAMTSRPSRTSNGWRVERLSARCRRARCWRWHPRFGVRRQ